MSSNRHTANSKSNLESFHRRHLILLFIFLVVSIWSAISPKTRIDWFLENILVWLAFIAILIFRNKIRLSDWSYIQVTVYLSLQVYASHYAYMPPIGMWIGHLIGSTRNDYDRLVHFCFGFLLFLPIKECFQNAFGLSRRVAIFCSLLIIGAGSAIYEIIEWLAALVLAPQAAIDFLGSQGDVWDTQKDMAMAILGSLIMFFFVLIWPKTKKK